jgi:UDP-N-acetylglucosamine acyltransferase
VSAPEIHPTAVVDPSAEIADGCFIGPYSIVGAGVTLGADCWLQHHVSLSGPSKFGPRNRFFAFTSIGQQTQDLKYVGEPTFLEVGEGNCFREFVTVHRGTSPGSTTRIGNGGNFLAYSHIAHDCIIGDRVIFSNNGTVAGHVEVGDFAVIGGLTAVHQFCRIGRHAITGGCSKIVQDVPPFMIADGNPAEIRGYNKIGLERSGYNEEGLRRVKEFYRVIYRSQLNVQQAVEQLRSTYGSEPDAQHLINFINTSSRGIIR